MYCAFIGWRTGGPLIRMSILIDHPRAPDDIADLLAGAPDDADDLAVTGADTDLTVDVDPSDTVDDLLTVDDPAIIDARDVIDLRTVEADEPAETLEPNAPSEDAESSDAVIEEPVADEPAAPEPTVESQPAPIATISIFGDLRAQQRQALVDLLFMPVDELPAHVVAPRTPLFPTMSPRPEPLVRSADVGVLGLGLRPAQQAAAPAAAPVIIGLEAGESTAANGSIDFVPATPAGNGPLIRRIALLVAAAAAAVVVLVVLWSLLSGSDDPDTATVPGDQPAPAQSEEEPATALTTIPEPVVTTAVATTATSVETSVSSVVEPEPVAPQSAPVTRAATPTTRASRPSTQAPRTPSTGATPATDTTAQPPTTTRRSTTAVTTDDGLVVPPSVSVTDNTILKPEPADSAPTPTTAAPATTAPTISAPTTQAPASQPAADTAPAAD